MSKSYACPDCRRPLVRVDRRCKQPLRAVGGASLDLRPGLAPRVKCSCGKTLVLLEGKL